MRPTTVLALATFVEACAAARPRPTPTDPPLLALSPASLAAELHLVQRVTVERGDRSWVFDALVEADRSEVLIAALVMSQAVARLKWDGQRLEEEHSAQTPDAIQPARILSDVQLAFWPASAVRDGLPPHFDLDEGPLTRSVTRDGKPFAMLRYVGTPPAWSRVELTHFVYGYRLIIESKEAP